MALKYLEYFGTCGHWLLTGVYTSAGKSARAVDDWKDDDRVGFIPCLCCAAMSVWPLPIHRFATIFPSQDCY